MQPETANEYLAGMKMLPDDVTLSHFFNLITGQSVLISKKLERNGALEMLPSL